MERNAPLLTGSGLAFTAVAQQRNRADGWTPRTQADFVRAIVHSMRRVCRSKPKK